MNNFDEQHDNFIDDEQVQITDLNLGGLPRRRQRIAIFVVKCITTSWIRFSLTGLLILALLLVLVPQIRSLLSPANSAEEMPEFTPPSHSLSLTSAPGRLFVQTADNTLIAFESANGHVLWQRSLPGIATLSATADVLYCYYVNADGITATLEDLKANDGQVIWRQNLSASLAMSRGEQPGFVLNGDTVYALAADGTIFAFQADNGHLRWSISTGVIGPSLKTVLYAQGSIVEVKSFADDIVHILSASDGREMARALANGDGDPFPVDGQEIYALPGSDDQSVGRIIQVFRVSDGALLWNLPLPNGAGTVMEQDGVVYLSNIDHSSLTARRGSDGHVLWTYHTSDGRAMVNSFLVQNGIVYLLQQDSTLVSIRVSDGQILWRTRLTTLSKFISVDDIQPLLDQGILLFYDPDPPGTSTMQLLALHISDGSIAWQTASLQPGDLDAQAGILYLFRLNEQIETWDDTSGQYLWSYQAAATAHIAANLPGMVLLLDDTGRLGALRTSDGRPLWFYP